MARFLFITWDGGGNQPPAVGIAQELRDQGHDVIFACYESQRPYFQRRGFSLELLERSSKGMLGAPPEHMIPGMVEWVWAAPEHFHDVPEVVARVQPDVLVVDCLMTGALAAAEDLDMPVAALFHSGPGLLVPPGGRWEGFVLTTLNSLRAAQGRAEISTLWELWGFFPTLCTTITELDPLASQVPASFEYVGPVFERTTPSGWQSPWPAEDHRPLIMVSFSTTNLWDQTSRIQKTLEALTNRECRVLVTTGMADASKVDVPDNAALIAYVPHHEVLPHVALMVTHAGHGTVSAALAHSVPLICLPNKAADQPALAARLEALGAGRALDGDAATSAEIAAAIAQVLTDDSYSAVARRLEKLIAGAPGAATSAVRLSDLARRVGGPKAEPISVVRS